MEENTKRKRGRRGYLNQFRRGEDGQFAYQGSIYTYVEQGLSFSSVRIRLWALCLLMTGCFVGAGCFPVPGMMDTFYVLIPYVIGLMCCVSVCWAMCRLQKWGAVLRAYVYEATVKALPGRCGAVLVLSVLTVIGEIIYLCLEGSGGAGFYIGIYMVLLAAAFCMALQFFRQAKAMVWKA